MVDKLILDIHHSDDYTDYLLMTAGLTNKRIIPMLSPSTQQVKAASDNHTLILKCYNNRKELSPWDSPVDADTNYGSLRILSRFYLDDDGNINAANAEMIRQTVHEYSAFPNESVGSLSALFPDSLEQTPKDIR